jgi:hypothetical protein
VLPGPAETPLPLPRKEKEETGGNATGLPASVPVPGSVPAAMPAGTAPVAPAAEAGPTDRPLKGVSALPQRGAAQGTVIPASATVPVGTTGPAGAGGTEGTPANGSATKDGKKETERWRLFKRR